MADFKLEDIRNLFKNKSRIEVRLSGAGGQGLILASVIMAEAVGLFEGKNVAQTQAYGPEARGGATRADVVISEGEIYYPKATKVDLLLVMTEEALTKYKHVLKPEGVLIYDEFYVHPKTLPVSRSFGFDITRTARDVVGKMVTANMVALGIISALTGIMSEEALKKAVERKAPEGTEEINLKAVEEGIKLVKERFK